jgi:hypothetical protein
LRLVDPTGRRTSTLTLQQMDNCEADVHSQIKIETSMPIACDDDRWQTMFTGCKARRSKNSVTYDEINGSIK